MHILACKAPSEQPGLNCFGEERVALPVLTFLLFLLFGPVSNVLQLRLVLLHSSVIETTQADACNDHVVSLSIRVQISSPRPRIRSSIEIAVALT